MKSLNKILILFLFIISVSFVGIWEFLQSEWMADKVSYVATKYVKEVLKSDVKFEKIEFDLFPPAAEFKRVHFTGSKNNLDVDIQLENISLEFDPLNVFSTEFNVENIKLVDGLIKISESKNKSDKKSKKKNNIPKHIELDFLKEIPVNNFSIEDVVLKYNEHNLNIDDIQLRNNLSSIEFRANIIDLSLYEYINKNIRLDSVYLYGKVNEYSLNIYDSILKSGFVDLKIKGLIQAYLSENIKYNLSTQITTPIEHIHDYLEFKKIGYLEQGDLYAKIKIKGTKNDYTASADINITNFETDFLSGEEINGNVLFTEKNIKFNTIDFKNNGGKFKLVRPFEFYNIATRKFVEEPIVADLKNIEISNALRYLRKNFDLLSGKATGIMSFELPDANNYFFEIKDKFIFEDLAIGKKEELEVIRFPELEVNNAKFEIKNKNFFMNLEAEKGETLLGLFGEVKDSGFTIKIPAGFVDLKDIDHILGYQVEGKGTFDFDLSKQQDEDLILKLKPDLKKINFMGYEIEQARSEIVFNISNSDLNIRKLFGASGTSKFQAEGNIYTDSKKLDLTYKIQKLNFNESKKIFKPLLDEIKFSSNEIHGEWDVDGKIVGLATPDRFNISGSVNGINNYFFDEGFDKLSTNFEYEKNQINLSNFKGKKGSGQLIGSGQFLIPKKRFEFKTTVNSIKLDDIFFYSKLPFSINATINGYINGAYSLNGWEFDSIVNLSKTHFEQLDYENSRLGFIYNKDKLQIDFDVFQGIVKLKSEINFTKKSESDFDLSVRARDFYKYLAIFKGINAESKVFDGILDYDLKSKFMYENEDIINLESNLQRLYINKSPVQISYTSKQPEILIKNNLIEKWDMNVRNRGNYIISEGNGDLKKSYKNSTRVKIHASLLEVLNPIISKADGELRALVEYSNHNGVENYQAITKSNNLSLTTKYLLTAVTNSNVEITYDNGIISIKKFIANLVRGKFSSTGEIDLNNVIPELDIRYRFKDAGITILKKSALEFSGEGSVIGKNFPYTVGGDFYIQKFNLINEFTELGSGNDSLSKADIDYLPEDRTNNLNQLINLNINVLTREPILITNSIADIGFTGNVHILGGEKDIRMDGKVSLASRDNIIKFKNNTFALSKGNIFFRERQKYKNPELDFLASSTINNHNVSVELIGPLKNFKLNLTSDPVLAQSDILSLIAFGYTDDLSSDLTAAEKESMTTAGVGSIIFDSFKINETLKNEFGLEVNLGTEISQVEGSYLESRGNVGENSESKVSSSTKIELTKKVNEAMSLSVSSTVGNNTEQKQSVNLNYNINKNVSVEGVYESRSTDDAETINNDTSFGTDVKWKWSFK